MDRGLFQSMVVLPLAATGLCGCAGEVWTEGALPSAVVEIDWASFQAPPPSDENAVLVREILLGSNRYALTTWYDEIKDFDAQGGEVLDLGGLGEHDVRPVASEAFALAVSLRLGAYDATETGVSVAIAEERTIRLLGSVAACHLANQEGGWGGGWQTALWAAYAGTAGWLLWDELSPAAAHDVAAMVRSEARALVGVEVPYFRDEAGQVVRPGDSKAEENAWNAQLLYLAVNMMPDDDEAPAWEYKAAELAVSSYARPADLREERTVNGRPLAQWLRGSNANPDATVINHDLVHPDYVATAAYTASAPLWYGLRREPTPAVMFEGVAAAYAALGEVAWAPGASYEETSCLATACDCGDLMRCAAGAPGGTIYVRDSSSLYFPHGTDWGVGRRMNFALFDTIADAFELDAGATVPARTWETLHAGAVLAGQLESPDRRAYTTDEADVYAGREEWVAAHAAMGWFAKFVVAQGAYARTDRFLDVVLDDRDLEFEVEDGDWEETVDGAPLGIGARAASAEEAKDGARASWRPRLPAGTYTVQVRWGAAPSLTSRAVYEVKHGGGRTAVTVDQRDGDRWVSLGTFVLGGAGGDGEIVLTSPQADGALAADGVRFVRAEDVVARSHRP